MANKTDAPVLKTVQPVPDGPNHAATALRATVKAKVAQTAVLASSLLTVIPGMG